MSEVGIWARVIPIGSCYPVSAYFLLRIRMHPTAAETRFFLMKDNFAQDNEGRQVLDFRLIESPHI